MVLLRRCSGRLGDCCTQPGEAQAGTTSQVHRTTAVLHARLHLCRMHREDPRQLPAWHTHTHSRLLVPPARCYLTATHTLLVRPPQYASFAGIVGVVVYAIASGIPILLIALFGTRITRDMPHVFSLSDFMGWRFGPVAKTVVVLVALFNMSIALLAEYTTIGTIFSDFVGSVSFVIIIVIGVLTLLYTAAGGLAVSIATDQVQGIASAILALVVTIFVAATYR